MMVSKKYKKTSHFHVFLKRVARSLILASTLLFFSLGMGMLGYHHYELMSWTEAYLNAAMILSGMGPTGELHSTGGKIFAGTYALFSGVILLVIMALILAPVIHHFFQKLPIEKE